MGGAEYCKSPVAQQMRKSEIRRLSKSVGTVLFTDKDNCVGIATGFVAHRDDIIFSTHHMGGPFTKPELFVTPDNKAYKIACYFNPEWGNSVCILRTFRGTGLPPLQCAKKVDARQGDRLTAIGYKDGINPVVTAAAFHHHDQLERSVYFHGIFTPGSCGTPVLDGEGKVIAVYHGSSKRRRGYNISTSIVDYNDRYKQLMEDPYLWDGEYSLRKLLSRI